MTVSTTSRRRSALDAEVAMHARPHPGQIACGDACRAERLNDVLVVVMADGLGHGDMALQASGAAVDFVLRGLRTDPRRDLGTLMGHCHEHLRTTRGAAVTICRVDLGAWSMQLCGVGNVEVVSNPRREGVGVSMPGTVGVRMRKAKVFEHSLFPGDIVALHTDGLASSFRLEPPAGAPLESWVSNAVEGHGRALDDAALVVLRFRLAGPRDAQEVKGGMDGSDDGCGWGTTGA